MYERGVKRVLDLTLSAAACILLSPLLALTSFCILIEDGRPVLFSQHRPGRSGNPFLIYKFRSMAKSAPELPSGANLTPPVTRVGRIIRRLNIDELPQLFNILKGDMSVVGPRPPLGSQNRLIELRAGGGALYVRPGLTGLAQVNSYDGMTDEAKAALDNEYASHVTFRGDALIVLKTLRYMLHPPPTY